MCTLLTYLPTLLLTGKDRGTCSSAAYISGTHGQKCYTISEVASDCHELMMP